MKRFTQKFFLLAMGLMLSMGASAQTPTGDWNAYEDDGITHANPTVLYKRGSDPNNPIYIIPAWDKRLYPHDSSSNGYLRVRKIDQAGTKGMIVTAMGLLYDENGVAGFNGQFSAPLQVWCEKTQEWLNVDAQLFNSLTYADLFEGGQSVVSVFKDSSSDDISSGTVKNVHQIKETNHTIPTSVAWNGGGTGTITELGVYAYGNATISYPTPGYCRSAFKNLTIPNTITKIGEYAFRGNSTMETVTFEEGGTLSAVPRNCFEGSKNLNTVTLSSSISNIGGAAFGGCGNLNKIVFTSDKAVFGEYNGFNPFQQSLGNTSLTNPKAETCIIEVPLGTVNDFLSADGQQTLLATMKFPLCSKFPLETTSGLMTYCSDADFTFKKYNTTSKAWEDGDMKVYYVDKRNVEIENSRVVLTEVTEKKMVPAWSRTGEGDDAITEDFGVVLRGTSGETYDIFYPNGRGMTSKLSMEDTDNCLHGCIAETPITLKANSTYFILSNGEFHRVTSNGKCKANRAYIMISGAETGGPGFESSQLALSFPGEDPTGITTHEVQGVQNDAYYTLQGIQVKQPQKGIVIKNGKKFVIK